jgi:hypothetical protein
MTTALYFPFSRCLDEVALKQAVLLYDRLTFVDPVSSEERSALYAGSHTSRSRADQDQFLAQRWQRAEAHYELLAQEGLVETVDAADLIDFDAASHLLDAGLELDLEVNDARELFGQIRPWSVLERRLPSTVLDGPLRRWVRPAERRTRDGQGTFIVPYAVGSSLSLSSALAVGHITGATLMTDSERHHELLLRRLRSTSSLSTPGMKAPRASGDARRLIELRIIEELAPRQALRAMEFDEILEYRRANESAREALSGWIDRLAAEASNRPWEPSFEHELARITAHARDIAAEEGRWTQAAAGLKHNLSTGAIVAAGTAALTGVVAPGVSKFAALVLGGAAAPAVKDLVDDLLAKRSPEENAVAYLVHARGR